MIAVPFGLKFDIARLRTHFQTFVSPLEPVIQTGSACGGWTVLSSNGSYKDGWHTGSQFVKKEASREDVLSHLANLGVKGSESYCHPTEICHGYLLEVIETIRSHGFNPTRARLINLFAGRALPWHFDSPEHAKHFRLHVPIITNPQCFFEVGEERFHMAADGSSYLVKVSQLHRARNSGSEDRIHLVMDLRPENQNVFSNFQL